jgi:hypothetical protein
VRICPDQKKQTLCAPFSLEFEGRRYSRERIQSGAPLAGARRVEQCERSESL